MTLFKSVRYSRVCFERIDLHLKKKESQDCENCKNGVYGIWRHDYY